MLVHSRSLQQRPPPSRSDLSRREEGRDRRATPTLGMDCSRMTNSHVVDIRCPVHAGACPAVTVDRRHGEKFPRRRDAD